MSDIVKELRKAADHDEREKGFACILLRSAADEIARLEAELGKAQSEYLLKAQGYGRRIALAEAALREVAERVGGYRSDRDLNILGAIDKYFEPQERKDAAQ